MGGGGSERDERDERVNSYPGARSSSTAFCAI